MPTYALIGYPLSHSFSRAYFTEKFARMGLAIDHQYVNFEIKDVKDFKKKWEEYPDLRGCNVTLPHKRSIIPLLDGIDPVADRIGAVNTIVVEGGLTMGYNTDYLGFRDDLMRQLRMAAMPVRGGRALVLGTGGAARAVCAALDELIIDWTAVSRDPGPEAIGYDALKKLKLDNYRLIVNTTPLGMEPDTGLYPDIPYKKLSGNHFCYDLVYNPAETEFMKRSEKYGARVSNGLGMLHAQAEAAWKIWSGRELN